MLELISNFIYLIHNLQVLVNQQIEKTPNCQDLNYVNKALAGTFPTNKFIMVETIIQKGIKQMPTLIIPILFVFDWGCV